MPDLILKGKTPRQMKPGGWVAPESIVGGCKGVSSGIHSRCIRICIAQPSVISSLWPPTICWRLFIRCICAIYCDFLQGVDLTPTLWEFYAAVQSWVKWMLIFFLLFLIVCYCYSVFRRRDGSRVTWTTSSGAKMWQIMLLGLFPASSACFYKILCEYRCVVNPVYKQNIWKSVRTSFPAKVTYSWVFSY